MAKTKVEQLIKTLASSYNQCNVTSCLQSKIPVAGDTKVYLITKVLWKLKQQSRICNIKESTNEQTAMVTLSRKCSYYMFISSLCFTRKHLVNCKWNFL